jgi:hypothetical protein
MNTKRFLSTVAMTAGLAIGLAANANAAPVSPDFWECAAQHPDPTEFGVCCIFYGGTFDEKTGECWIDHEVKLEEADSGPRLPTKGPVLTRVPGLEVASAR